ncbi:LLM class flavin-dependent oxidoreductase [Actinoplanes sp. NPDC051346]|uniref:LLM class flavin-dependent oxidoreductase n=1 Tax=Actinoplanes sp. NPDC051346 TaxID=3155048 RepID=UPI00342ED756
MRFGIGIGRTLDAAGAARLAQHADELGYDHCTFIESQNLCRDSTIMMALAAARTSRIRLGHAVTNPYTRHAAVLANTIATIDELAPGRVFLGIGAGGSAVAMVGRNPRPLTELGDYVEFFRDFTAGKEATWQGLKMRSEWARRDIPVLLGTHGSRSCRLAGQVADGVFLPGFAPEIVKWKREQVAAGAAAAGRGPGSLELWSRGAVFVHEDADHAREYVRSYAATSAYFLWKSALVRQSTQSQALREAMPEPLLAEMARLAVEYAWDQHEVVGAPHAAALSAELIDCFAIYGPQSRCLERLHELESLGVDRASFVLYGVPDQQAMISRFAESVAQRFRSDVTA